MKVREMISRLNELDQDLEVVTYNFYGSQELVVDVDVVNPPTPVWDRILGEDVEFEEVVSIR